MSLAIENSEAAILGRILNDENARLPREAAEFILRLRFPESDIDRMNALAEKARSDSLSADEADELENYRHLGHLLEILKSKARLAKKELPQAA